MANNTIDSTIVLNRDEIRLQIIDTLQRYLELENVDLTKSSFLSFMIDTMSTLTSNMLFYQTSVYKEFFLTTAQLPESVLNLSTFLGYNTQEAEPAITSLMMSIQLSFDDDKIYFKIPQYINDDQTKRFKFKAGETEFVTDYEIEVFLESRDNSQATIVMTDRDNNNKKLGQIPTFTGTGSDKVMYFAVPVRQVKYTQQEFQIDEDLRRFRFVELDVPVDGKVAEIEVQVIPPGQAYSENESTYWQEQNSIYLMDEDTQGFVSRRTDEGRKLYFGNGIIGKQPEAGSTVVVMAQVTEGESGNVIPGAVNSGDKIYHISYTPADAPVGFILYNQSVLRTRAINYEVINTTSATGGRDEESIEDIRSNAIASLTSLSRLVSGNDYENIKTVIPGLPIVDKAIPILKKSDARINEIQLYTILDYFDEAVPLRNVWSSFNFADYPGNTIPRGTLINYDGVDYETIFDLYYDPTGFIADVSSYGALYKYILTTLSQLPILENRVNADFEFYPINFTASKSGSVARLELEYFSTEADDEDVTCELTLGTYKRAMDVRKSTMEFSKVIDGVGAPTTLTVDNYIIGATSGAIGKIAAYTDTTSSIFYDEGPPFFAGELAYESTSKLIFDVTDTTATVSTFVDDKTFIYEANYNEIPDGDVIYLFQFNDVGENILSEYSSNLTFKKDLSSIMLSNLVVDGTNALDATSMVVYDIPCIKKSYYDALDDQAAFEITIFQALVNEAVFSDYRMITDFTNLKFTNTTGYLENLYHNELSYTIISQSQTTIPGSPSGGDRYIVNGRESTPWFAGTVNYDIKDRIVEWSSDATSWVLIEPRLSDVASIADETNVNGDVEHFIFSEYGWIPVTRRYEIPFNVTVEVYKEKDYPGTDSQLVDDLKTTIYEAFESQFGPNINIHRSEIVDVVHNVEGVDYCRVIRPESSIFYDFKLTDFTQDALLKYAPEYVFFTRDSINVRIR